MKRPAQLFPLLPLMVLALLAVDIRQPLTVEAGARIKAPQFDANTAAYSSGNLIYHGGPIMPKTTRAFVIFWEPPGWYVSSTYNSLILRYFNDVGTSPLYYNNTQYTDSKGNMSEESRLGGYWIDTAGYPAQQLNDQQVREEVIRAMQTNGWSPALYRAFFVFTAEGVTMCFGTPCRVYCAYHYFFGRNTIYAAMPYAGTDPHRCGLRTSPSPNGDFDADSEINLASHEQMEAATDPLENGWLDAYHQEIGDKCVWTFGNVGLDGSNVIWNQHPYIVQEEWDNAQQGCVLAGP